MSPERLEQAYRRMCLIRAVELRLNELFLQGVLAGTTHLCLGQEACAVGACLPLQAEDVVFSNHRGHGHLLARGADPGRLMAEIFGSPKGYSAGRGGSQHVAVKEINFLGTHGITGGTVPLAAGAALHKKLHSEPGVAAVFFGDGALGQGVCHESMNMAAIWDLPVLFICENNLYAMSSAYADFSPIDDTAARAAAYGMHGCTVDGNDVAAVAATVGERRAEAAAGNGPQFIELKTYRISGHSRGDACDYRTREEEELWRQRDPILLARRQLEGAGRWDDALEAGLEAEIKQEVEAAENFAAEGVADNA